MNICICHDEKLKNFLLKNGLKHQASGVTPSTKSKYWVYNETPAYTQCVEKYKEKEVES